VTEDIPEEGERQAISWEALLAANPRVVAWIEVPGAGISLPVVQAREEDGNAWLDLDLWGNPSEAGTPFVDHRCGATSAHVLVYGHHLVLTGGMFSELAPCFDQEAFDERLACGLTWSTPDGATAHCDALCAASIDEGDALTQTFSFEGEGALRGWLETLVTRSGAVSAHPTDLIASTRWVVTLVTCNAQAAGQSTRTAVTFVGS